MYKHLLVLFFLPVLFSGCELYPQDDYEPEVVVEAFLVAGAPAGKVYITTTSQAFEKYSFGANKVDNADVELSLLTGEQDSAEETVISFRQNSDGIYIPAAAHTVLPGRTYQLRISIPDRDLITAFTTVPARFTNRSITPDSIVYQSEQRLEVKIPREELADQLQYFIFTTRAEDPVYNNLVPFYRDLLDLKNEPETLEDDLLRLSVNNSGIISEGNFETDPEGHLVVRYPWIGIAFFGYNTITAQLMDRNAYDFIRSQSVQLGGSSVTAGEIPNVITHIDGALGVFGSFSTDTLRTKVIARPGYQ